MSPYPKVANVVKEKYIDSNIPEVIFACGFGVPSKTYSNEKNKAKINPAIIIREGLVENPVNDPSKRLISQSAKEIVDFSF